ncbi:MAG: PAS domain S-box protein [Deltaproteobacteria bacterium]|nr:PAS domain S-box protein [Deltaproteobacteria bacterium]
MLDATALRPLRALFVEDWQEDVLLITRLLRRAGFEVDFMRVETASDFREALESRAWDVVLASYRLPKFSAFQVLSIAKESQKQVPVLVVTASIGEDATVRLMKAGASECIMKDNLARLVPAIERELAETKNRTACRQAEAALREREAYLRAVMENVHDGIVTLDEKGVIESVNPATCRIFGLSERDLVGSTIDSILLSPVLDAGHGTPTEMVSRRATGEVLHLEVITSTMRLGDRVLFVVTLVDRAERRQFERLEREKEHAQRQSEFKSRFLANMSHDLRTPLNAVIGFSELLDQEIHGPLTPKQREYVQHVLRSGRHLLSLLNDILDLSKVEAGRMEINKEWCYLTSIVEGVQSVVQALAERQGVRLAVCIPAGLPQLFVDPVRIKQVLYNLLSNGIKFTPRGGSVALSAMLMGPAIEISVEDTGIGIDEKDIPRLFREFEQIEHPSGAKPEGTGLGLALSRRLTRLHGGQVRVRSKLGEGSTFTVVLPLVASFSADMTGEPSA